MKISVITINFNNAEGLEKTIQSVVNQKNVIIEYLVIDGGSTDRSVNVIKSYGDGIAYSVSEKDSGVFNAMNKGIKASTGEYLLFLNSGDIFIDNHVLEKVVTAGFDADLVTGNMIYNNRGNKREWIPAHRLTFSLFYFTGIPHPSTFIKKSLFNLVGLYDEDLCIVSDWKFFLLAACKYACSYKHIDIFISEFDEDGMSSDTANIPKILAEREKVINENFSAFLPDYEELWAAKKQLRKLRYTIKIKKFLGIR